MDLDDLIEGGLVYHNAIARKHLKTLYEIRNLIDMGLFEQAHEAWEELPQDDQITLNKATSKGGLLHLHERSIAVKGIDRATGWEYGR